jgi:septum formation topological specificity factor MinE
LETLKDEIIASSPKHVEIDRRGVQITLRRAAAKKLVADIPLLDGRKRKRVVDTTALGKLNE